MTETLTDFPSAFDNIDTTLARPSHIKLMHCYHKPEPPCEF
jgi:hypothetical protein